MPYQPHHEIYFITTHRMTLKEYECHLCMYLKIYIFKFCTGKTACINVSSECAYCGQIWFVYIHESMI